MEVLCPSGLRGEVRKIRGAEANLLTDRKALKKDETFDRILSACWVTTDDVGPYEAMGVSAGDGPIPWDKILVCDRFYALTCIRIATYGSSYTFPTQCTDYVCKHRFEWEVNLATDFPVLELPESSREQIATGDNRFETEVRGHQIVFHLQDGAREKRSGKQARSHRGELITLGLSSRIDRIDEITGAAKISKWLKEADFDLQTEILEALEEHDGGIDQRIEVECQECLNQFEVILPFEGEGFWIPSTLKSRSKKRKKGKQMRTIAGPIEEETTEEEAEA